MTLSGELLKLNVDDIELDRHNPRIKKFIEMYGDDEPSAEQFFLALGSASDDESESSAKFEQLKNSIQTYGGIIQPIIVNRTSGGRMTCIEGNTRVALYKHFKSTGVDGEWSTIPALVWDDMSPRKMDEIRLQVHLVGTRNWDPYSKAKYLWDLRNKDKLPFSEIVEFCGGRKKEVLEHINAYDDMENYYRPVAKDANFDVRRFSGFLELQRKRTKEAIAEAGFTLTDFAKWVHSDGKKTPLVYPLHHVRDLGRILRNERAKEVFLKQGAKKAVEVLPRDGGEALEHATILQLAQELWNRLNSVTFNEWAPVRRDPSSEIAESLTDVVNLVQKMLSENNGEA